MRYLSRRFSGFVYLYVVVAFLIMQVIFILQNSFRIFIIPYAVLQPIGYLLIISIIFIVLAHRKYPMAQLLHINTFSFKQFISVIFLSICIYIFSRTVNTFIAKWSEAFFYHYNGSYFSSNKGEIWPYLITSCLIPALVQGVIFPGIIQSGFHGFKAFKSCLLAGILYVFFLQINSLLISPFSFVYYLADFIVCFTFCYICLRSSSIIPGVIAIFFFYFLSCIRCLDWFYNNILSPLGFSDVLAIAAFLTVSIVLGGLLIWKFPKSNKSSKALDKQTIIDSFRTVKKSLSKLTYLPEDALQSPVNELVEKKAEASENEGVEAIIYPDDSEKQRKNTGFIIAVSLLTFLIIADVVLSIVMSTIQG